MSRQNDDTYGETRSVVLPRTPMKCDECGGTVIQDYADWVCQDCGLVHEQIMVNDLNSGSA